MKNALVTELVAVVLHHLAPVSSRRNPSRPFDDFVSVLITGKSVEQQQAEQLIEAASNVVSITSRLNTKRKFNKIIKNG